MIERLSLWSMWVFAFSIPWEKTILLGELGSIARILGTLAFVLTVSAILYRRYLRPLVLSHAFLILFVMWAAISYFWSPDAEASAEAIFTLLQLGLMSILIWNVCSERHSQRRMLQAYVLGACVSSISTFIMFRSAQEFSYQRYAAEGFDPNDLGLVLAISIPMSYFLSLHCKGTVVWLYRMAIVLAVCAIGLTASRTAMLATIAGLVIVPLTLRAVSRTQKIVLVGICLVGSAVAATLIPPESWERFGTTLSEIQHGDLNNRLTFWGAAWRMAVAHPLQGVGVGTFGIVATGMVGFADKPIVVHNTFLSVLAETGAVGLLLFVSLLATLIKALTELDSEQRALWIAVLLTWGVGVSALSWENRKPTWLLFSLILVQCASGAAKRIRGHSGAQEVLAR
ncbi:MAG: O-antigen ligase family protein [Terracidiphilus sp.]